MQALPVHPFRYFPVSFCILSPCPVKLECYLPTVPAVRSNGAQFESKWDLILVFVSDFHIRISDFHFEPPYPISPKYLQ